MANSKKGTAQVQPPTPKQRVVAAHGSKSALVDAIIAGIDGGAEDRSALLQVSNLRLMKHYHAVTRMVAAFGNKDGLIEAILATRYGKRQPDAGAREKLEGYSAWRLMDLHRQEIDLDARRQREAAAADKAAAVKAKRRAKLRARRAARP